MIRGCLIEPFIASKKQNASWDNHVHPLSIILKKGLKAKTGSALENNDLPVFNVDIAFTLLHMSAIIYERSFQAKMS
jgi:hypothetical protein